MTVRGTTLLDTSALVGLISKTDQHHGSAVKFSKVVVERCVTSWPVITEADYLLSKVNGGRDALHQILIQRDLEVIHLPLNFVQRHSELCQQFADRDIQLADASLVWLAKYVGTDRVFTFDRADFQVYRIKRGHQTLPFQILPEPNC